MRKEFPDGLLYNPLDEHDACGVGFVADISGHASHNIVVTAMEALSNLKHRGAVDADGRTGDGAGLLTQLPTRFFRREVERLGHRPVDEIAVGMFFYPRDQSVQAQCRSICEQIVKRHGLVILGWRLAPVDESVLGAKAVSTAPAIEQLLLARGRVPNIDFETTLYKVRREIEEQTSNIKDFYIPSFSSRSIVYKGLFVGTQIGPFYSDLRDPAFESPLAVFHQRYSTNTFPNWSLAQPFRLLAHNGEINTISGNRNWMRARERSMSRELTPDKPAASSSVIWSKGSDSASLDNVLEGLTMTGRDTAQALMTLIPEAYEGSEENSGSVRAFYDYAACLSEPWDGPAAVAFTDGRVVGAALDRNGLRPARYALTSDGRVIVASEAGVVQLEPGTVTQKGRLGPGQMIAVDTQLGILLMDDEIKQRAAAGKPYAEWVRRSMVVVPRLEDYEPVSFYDEDSLYQRMKTFGYTLEDVDRILAPMMIEGKEPAGSMGDDTPLAFLSTKPRLLYSYFKQRFAQVTNPPIDPIRERLVMSLTTLLGPRGSLLTDGPAHAKLLKLSSPILSDATLDWLKQNSVGGFPCAVLNACFDDGEGENGLRHSLNSLRVQAAEAIKAGASVLVLCDLPTDESKTPIPMLLAVGAVHNHLIREGLRMHASLIAETGEARDDHHIACLIGCGANGVNPSLAFEVIAKEAVKRGLPASEGKRNYRKALEDGLLKIMAKMGISTVASYCGSLAFEIVGIDANLVEEYFSGAACRLGGIGLSDISHDALRFRAAARDQREPGLEDGGIFRYRNGGEYHSFNPAVFRALHRAARNGETKDYERYAGEVLGRPPAALRDLIEFRRRDSIPLTDVEATDDILSRFSTSGMSLGALSKKAHETLAIAMNRLGAKSNSGEGGEDRSRFRRRPGGDLANSRIKQIASARFGVTPEYLVSADELEIKMAQGSKPGEGGQLPGHKVTTEIAAIRHSVPGVALISPPPHHDIYSIEDLAQLIYDLRQINPAARIAVKLVSEAGIGTIAAGVAKAKADIIHISGHDGGTGASPLGSIKNAGTPWELGLAETQQVLVMNGLRGRVRLRVDGGLKTGRDVVIAAMLGAEEFGFATAAVVALGCVMARQCHLNTCPVGIATQDHALRRKFTGTPEMVVNFFQGLAEDIRLILADLGFRSLDEIIGRSDLLLQKSGLSLPRSVNTDLRPILARADKGESASLRFSSKQSLEEFSPLQLEVARAVSNALNADTGLAATFKIKNTDRTIGASVAGSIARLHGDAGLPDRMFELTFVGSAGQSFGAFNIGGVRLTLIGEANDYVAKGMSGGEIVIHPPAGSSFDWSQNAIIGNTVMYGATGGSLFAAGRAGERFAVRNSGGLAVVEGVGDHGCEYMTAGAVIVLGEVGRNFAAGMTGGVAYVFDDHNNFEQRCNRELVELSGVGEHESPMLRALIERHYKSTGSSRARYLLSTWERSRHLFWKVVTQAEAPRHREAELPRVNIPTAVESRISLIGAE